MASRPRAPVGYREFNDELARQWRRFARAATIVAVLTSPVTFVFLHYERGIGPGWSLLWTIISIGAFRGLLDLIVHRAIPWPSLFGAEDPRMKEEDVVNRRRWWAWRFWVKVFLLLAVPSLLVSLGIRMITGETVWPWEIFASILRVVGGAAANPQLWGYVALFGLLFIGNFLIFLGPMVAMGISQIKGYEPGDANWGVKLSDVRGQQEAKQEVTRIVSLWQSGEEFERAGGKRERGILFLGAPGTGKTMLAKAIATGFNSPIVTIPGSGFAQTFIGIDVIIVRWLARKAKKLARKWGGQCIVFIDEIDAVGMRRAALGGGQGHFTGNSFEEFCFFGPWGSLTSNGDLYLENRAWRDRLFAERAPQRPGPSGLTVRLGSIVNQAFPGMMGGMGQMALNQLLIVMDGIDTPPFTKRVLTNRLNTLLDMLYVVPRKLGDARLRFPAPRPRREQIYFIGATNVPFEALDPALTRPGRMGRHVWFQTPTKRDRLDIFDLYLAKVAHEPDLDRAQRRDELARITNGYSPAMIEQVCSMALTYAHHDGREEFGWPDIVEAMTTVEAGTAINIDYIADETRAVAIHEAGHAVAAHAYMKSAESTRISIRKRGGSLGHHMALEKDERFSSWRHEEMSRLIWTLGAMAAERVFYGENSTGVGGDVQSGTARAAWMVGMCAMAPARVDFPGRFDDAEAEEQARERVMKRFERIGTEIMNRAMPGGPMNVDPIASVLGDHDKKRMSAQLLGQAYVAAHNLIDANRPGVEQVADALVQRRELHGDEVLQLLEGIDIKIPEVDLLEERAWPTL